jgi:hypothetical protein
MERSAAKDFLTDLRSGLGAQGLMRKYNLSAGTLDEILGRLRRPDLVALRRLWEQDKLSDSQFMRPFEEAEDERNGEGWFGFKTEQSLTTLPEYCSSSRRG